MSQLYTSYTLYPSTGGIPNGYATRIENKPKNKIIFLDVTPAQTPPHMKTPSTNSVSPLRDNLIAPKIYKDVVYENIKPVFTLLRIMGVLPLTRSSGVNHFRLASPSMLYSIFCFIALISYIVYLTLNKVQILRTSEGKFEESVIQYLFTVYLFPIILIPVMWYETRKISDILNDWVEFEVAYKTTSRRALPVKLYQKALAVTIVIPILSMTSVIITHTTMVHFKPMQLAPYIFLETLTYVLGGYWYLLCETLSICANILSEDFHQAALLWNALPDEIRKAPSRNCFKRLVREHYLQSTL